MKIFLGIGSNLGERDRNIKEALNKIEEFIGPCFAASSVYETEPWGFRSDKKFLNMVIGVETDLSPSVLMGTILKIEANLGRMRNDNRYTSRVIDIDILFYGSEIIEQDGLVIPHPRIHERRFVLVPLCEIEEEFIHPVIKKMLKILLKECPDKSLVKLY